MPPDEVKTSEIPSGAAVDANTFLIGHNSTPTTERYQVTDLQEYFFDPDNIPANGANPITRDNELIFDHIASGCIWSADSAGSNRNASCTSGVVYINGKRLTVAAVNARTFTASKDVYCGLKDNNDGTAVWVYYDNTTNTGAPTLATIGNADLLGAIIVVGASSIASNASLNQGELDKALPIVSSVPMTFTSSQGDIIHPRDPHSRMLGFRKITSNFSTTSNTPVQVTGLTMPIIPPTGRPYRVRFVTHGITNGAAAANVAFIYDGGVGVGSQVAQANVNDSNQVIAASAEAYANGGGSLKTFNVAFQTSTGTGQVSASSTSPAMLVAELL